LAFFIYFYRVKKGEDKKKQEKFDKAYLRMAKEWSKLSHCERKQVGALIVSGRRIISDGFNGTPTGMDNCCEDDEGYTKWSVLHAEANAILKVASSTNSCEGATLYVTLSPCKDCSKLIHQSGIKRVVFIDRYKNTEGIEFLEKVDVEVVQIQNPVED
jgi:dCMP deaminase